MDIPNLTLNQPIQQTQTKPKLISVPILLIIIILGLVTGFIASRKTTSKQNITNIFETKTETVSTDKIDSPDQLEIGKVYGNNSKVFKDKANGTIEKGSINGEGTHILNRPGGKDQRASLTSSTVDLDLFVGKNVEVQGETNASNKTSWLLDVGTIKILE